MNCSILGVGLGFSLHLLRRELGSLDFICGALQQKLVKSSYTSLAILDASGDTTSFVSLIAISAA